jgi:hypothetical protein
MAVKEGIGIKKSPPRNRNPGTNGEIPPNKNLPLTPTWFDVSGILVALYKTRYTLNGLQRLQTVAGVGANFCLDFPAVVLARRIRCRVITLGKFGRHVAMMRSQLYVILHGALVSRH